MVIASELIIIQLILNVLSVPYDVRCSAIVLLLFLSIRSLFRCMQTYRLAEEEETLAAAICTSSA